MIAIGFRSFEKPINVNRPTEGVRLPPGEELHTHDAWMVFNTYKNHVENLNPQFYVEIHGSTLTPNRIEIAHNGIKKNQALEVKRILEEEVINLDLKVSVGVEGIDDIHYRAPAAKKWGVMGRVSPALHIEIPAELRRSNIDGSIELLVRFFQRINQVL